jgi:UMF1 family MFS transporter
MVKKWVNLLISYTLQPVILIAFLSLSVSIYDTVLYTGEHSLASAIAGRPISSMAEFNAMIDDLREAGVITHDTTFGMSQVETLALGIVLNVAAGLGAFAMGHLDDRLGGKRALELSVLGLIAGTLLAMLGPSKAWLWAGGILIGIFSGPNQASSRSLMGRFVPTDKENEFFGFLAFSGRATAFVGPLLFGQLSSLTGSQRVGLVPVLVFFVLGALLLRSVDEAEGIRIAGRGESPGAA